MATIQGFKIATTGSGHFCPGPTPALSLIPPTPPAGPVTAPFAYLSRSATATSTQTRLQIQGHSVLVRGSIMSIEKPGNLPGQPTGGDIVTHMTAAATQVITGRMNVLAGGKPIACTGDSGRMNVSMGGGFISQVIGGLITMDDLLFSAASWNLAACSQVVLDPISVVSGAVVDSDEIIILPGLIPLVWRRSYDSLRTESGPLGRGGWTHSLDQWIDIEGDTLHFRDDDGTTIVARNVDITKPIFLRRQQLEIRLDARGGAIVFSTVSRLKRSYRVLAGKRAQLVEIKNGCGHRIRLEYEGDSLARVLDTAGRSLDVSRNGRGHITRIAVFPANNTRTELTAISFEYDDDNNLAVVSDPLGPLNRYEYGEKRRLIKKTIATGLSFYYVYDNETGRCIRSFGDGGIHAGDLTYDDVAGTTHLTGNPEPRIFSWKPENGALLSIAVPDGSAARTTEYDADLLMLTEKNAAGYGPHCDYDERGNLVRITDPRGRISEQTYVNDLVVRRVVDGQTTEYSYNSQEQLEKVTYPGGAFLELVYDTKGRLVSVLDPLGWRSRFAWDEQNNCIEEQIRAGMRRVWKYDGLGRLVGCVDAQGNEVRRLLDQRGRVLEHQNPDGSAVRFEYDALGRRTKRTNELGQTTTTRYAGINSAVEAVFEDGSRWKTTYDLDERPQRIENPKCERYDLRYDRLGNVNEIRTFDGRILRAFYGKNGMVSRFVLPDGTFRAYQYDEADQLIEENTPHGNAKAHRDEDARKASFVLEDPAGKQVVDMAWDEIGRVVAIGQNGRIIRYEFDAQNRRTAIHLPSGRSTRYTYNDAGLVATLEHNGELVTFGYDSDGALVGYRFGNSGVEVRLVDDARGRTTREWVGKQGQTFNDRVYSWDKQGTLKTARDLRFGDTVVEHDEIGQLISAQSAAKHERFEYDAAGSVTPKGEVWNIDRGNIVRKTTTHEYDYDTGNRRTLKKNLKTGAKTEYFWDCRSRLREVLREDGTRILFTYDIFGRRIKKEVIAALKPTHADELHVLPTRRIVEYLWDDDLLIAEISEQGERTLVYHPGTMVPLLQNEPNCVLGVITNYLGQATDLIDQQGNFVFSGLYSAWGNFAKTISSQKTSPMLRSLGFHADDDIDLFYVRHRYFDPELMRFLSPDPLGIEGGANLFGFNGSPVMAVDPYGLACILVGNPRLDPALDHIMKYGPRDASTYQVYIHGTEHSVTVKNPDGTWASHGPDWLMARLKVANNFHNEPILLNSCNTGRNPSGFAQQLSARHGVNVAAPNEMVWGAGQSIGPPIGVADSRTHLPTGGEKYDPSRPGQWNYWAAGGYPHPINRPPIDDVGPPRI